MNAPTTRIPALDGWRALSILLVIGGHLVNYRYLSGDKSPLAGYLAVLGVKVFFVISGFLIAGLALNEDAATGTLSMTGFYRRRIFRILPAYFVYLATVLAFSWLGWISQAPAGVGWASAFVCNAPSLDCGWFVGHTWSLAYEEQFYLLFPLLFVLTPQARKARLFAAIHVFLAVTPVLTLLVLPNTPQWSAYRVIASHFGCISAGVMFAHYRDELAAMGKDRPALSACAALCVGACIVVASGSVGHLSYHMRIAIEALVLPLSIAWLILRTTVHRGYFAAALDWPPLRYVGKISFSLYLWQQLFTASPSISSPFSAFWLVPAAVLSYHLIEQPMVKLGRRSSRKARAGSSADNSSTVGVVP
jgi:peptidoglycan/LPS O-acetylase OafA/YrhL